MEKSVKEKKHTKEKYTVFSQIFTLFINTNLWRSIFNCFLFLKGYRLTEKSMSTH